MRLRAVSGIMLTLFMLSMLTLAFNIQPVKSDWTWTGTIYIRADGSVDPPYAPISTVDKVTYTLTDNIVGDVPGWSSAIVVERDNIVVDGAGYTLQGTGVRVSTGVFLWGRSNVTITNMEIKTFYRGIELYSSNNIISGNNITANKDVGIYVDHAFNNTISGNNITANSMNGIVLWSFSNNNTIYGNNINGIVLWSFSNNNTIYGNNITNGIFADHGSNNTIYGNNITGDIHLWSFSNNNTISGNNINGDILLHSFSNNNTIYGNNITSSGYGITLWSSSNNTIYHNNFINNKQWKVINPIQASATGEVNRWDNGYPSGGNYWSDYTGDEFFSGPYQNETGFDGIGDTPYVINENNQDNYPLIVPWPLKYKIYSLTVDPVFCDNTGTTLIQPSSWAIKFPSGNTRTVSSPVTYNLTKTGNYSIVNIIWKGIEVIPETTPSTLLTSDMVWSPSIKCILPTSLFTSLSSSTSYVGVKIEINGNLTCNEVGLSGAPILLSYSVTGGERWSDITLVNTTSDGSYSAEWMLPATGNYLVMATWSGNSTYPGTTTIINLAVIPFKEQNVFSVTSNSTISELAFNSTSRELSFTVTGPSGTTGYVNVYIAKTLIDNIADVKVYLDGDQLNYTVTSLDDSWLLHFTYRHSTHKVTINLGQAPFIPPQLITPLSLGIIAVALTIATILLLFKIRRGTPPTILDGVFRKLNKSKSYNKRHKEIFQASV